MSAEIDEFLVIVPPAITSKLDFPFKRSTSGQSDGLGVAWVGLHRRGNGSFDLVSQSHSIPVVLDGIAASVVGSVSRLGVLTGRLLTHLKADVERDTGLRFEKRPCVGNNRCAHAL